MAEKDISTDADLQLKKRAHRRLVGAAALALFAVIVLPMVMDREPRHLNQDIQVRIPSQDSTSLGSRIVPAKPAATPMPAPEPKPVVEQSVGANAKQEPVAASSAVVPTVAKPVVAATPVVTPEKPVVPEKSVVTDEKPAAKATSETRSASDASGQWVVQLGAYKETGNVKMLLAKLKGVGVPTFTEKYDSPQGPRTRVRAGPFASQDAAEKARTKIKIIGVDGPAAPK